MIIPSIVRKERILLEEIDFHAIFIDCSYHRATSLIFPSRIWTLRSACLAMESSCVIRTMVLPCLCRPWNSSIISFPVAESRLPVGSSVNCTPVPLCLENRGFNGIHTCVLCRLYYRKGGVLSPPLSYECNRVSIFHIFTIFIQHEIIFFLPPVPLTGSKSSFSCSV